MTGCWPHLSVSSVVVGAVSVPSPVTTFVSPPLLMRSTVSHLMLSSARLAEERPLHHPASAVAFQ